MSTVGAPVMLLGIGGMLWRAWDELLTRRGIEHVSPSLDELNFKRPQTIEQVLRPCYRLVINCAAWTDVDGAEEHEDEALVLNAAGPAHLARRCAAIGALLVHYSTDYVFNGQTRYPYNEDEPVDPISAYGRTKAQGEQGVASAGCEHLIIRTSGLFAPWGKNFVRTMARLMGQRDRIQVVDDQCCRVTGAEHLAASSMALVEAGARGVFHMAGGGQCTWYEFACQIARVLDRPCQVRPCTSAEYPTAARRPAFSVLDLAKIQELIGPPAHWHEQLSAVARRLEADDG